MLPAISVCIPVYGTESSLLNCLQSVAFQQGLESAGLEIIVVDDASPASCAEYAHQNQLTSAQIVSQFQQTSPWPVRHLQHEENLGLVEARRTAVAAATGDYIFCLDSDDSIPSAALATLYQRALEQIPAMYCTMAEDLVQYLLIAHGASRYVGIPDVVYNYTVNTGISSNTKITTLERWEQVCSTASVFTVLFACLQDLNPPFTQEQLAAIRKLCRSYVANNLQQLNHSVVPELRLQAYDILCDYWGEGLVKRMEETLQHK